MKGDNMEEVKRIDPVPPRELKRWRLMLRRKFSG